MCAHYVGFSDARVRALIAELTPTTPQEYEAARQGELELPDMPIDVYPKVENSIITPTFDTAIGVPELTSGMLESTPLQWGFTPTWSQQPIFNTRIESADKPTWRTPMEHRRCIIACRSFYEAHRTETTISERTARPIKQQYQFTVPDEPTMFIGAVRRNHEYSMVTTVANDTMMPVHSRMPLILRPEEAALWLSPDYRLLADRSMIPLDLAPVQ